MRLKTGVVLVFLLVPAVSGWAEDCPRLISRLPDGPATAVVVAGSRAFLGSGATVQVLDVSDPAAPQTIGRVEVETQVRRLAVEDDLVYVTAYSQGVTVIDVSDASTPVVASRITVPDTRYDSFRDVAAVGRIAFVAAGGLGLRVFDVADPQHPVQIGAIEGIGIASSVVVSSSFAYVVLNSRLMVVDVSDPADPVVVSTTNLDLFYGGDVVAIGSVVYIAGQTGLHVVDASDPAAPSVMGTFGWSLTTSVNNLDVWGDIAYVSDAFRGVRVIDVSNPTEPLQVKLIESPPYPGGVAAMEGSLLVAAGSEGLRAYDVSIPAAPVEIGSSSTPGTVRAVAVDGARGVATTGGGLRILDTTDPADPVEIGVYNPTDTWGAGCVELAGDHAFVCDKLNDRVVVLDISNANAVEPVAEIDAHRLEDLEVVPPYAYIQAAELLIIDVSDPTHPSQVASMDGVGQHIAVELPYLYGTGWTEGLPHVNGLSIVDVSDPVHPQTVGGAFEGDITCCSRVAVSGSWVYIFDYPGEGYLLNVVDAREPADPVIVGSADFGSVSALAVSGWSGLVGSFDVAGYAVLELDLTSPSNPTVVGRRDTPDLPVYISLADGFWYVGERGTGLEVFELCNTGLQEAGWLEIAAHGSGKSGSEWRTDAVVRNLGGFDADLELTLYIDGSEHQLTNSVAAGAQAIFEDVVGMMDVDGKGALEIRSSQPLAVIGRIYTEDDEGTFGQFLQGIASQDGLSTGDAAWLHGLRQFEQIYRSNVSVTNTGVEDASVRITLYDTDGGELTNFGLGPIEKGEVVQELAPLADRAGRPDIGWAMAKVEVVSGDGVLASGSVIDSRTNDPTTIPMVRED